MFIHIRLIPRAIISYGVEYPADSLTGTGSVNWVSRKMYISRVDGDVSYRV